MGFFGKLAFWKKKDDFGDLGKDLDMGKDFGLDAGQGPSPELGAGLEPLPGQDPLQKYPSFQQPNYPQQQFPQSSYPPQQQASFQPAYPSSPSFANNSSDSYIASKNLEVISSKLDALKASIDSINQRVANIEAIARGEQEEQRRKRYY